MTDGGLSVLRLKNGELSWETVLAERSVLAGTGTFLPNLGLVRDVDADGKADVLFPTPEGVAVYLSGPNGLQTSPAARVRFPLDDLQQPGGDPLVRRYPLPELRDVDGDHRPDLVLPQRGDARRQASAVHLPPPPLARRPHHGPQALPAVPGRGLRPGRQQRTATAGRTWSSRPSTSPCSRRSRP